MEGIILIQDLAVVLVVAGIAGWIARRIGLSSVVGYLLAGLLVGPHTPPLTLIVNQDRIETLSNVGVVFLMFAVGMGLSLQRLKRLGLSLLLATSLTALLVFNGTRLLAYVLHWGHLQGMFLASMFMVSSSAIISKVLSETGESHEKYGQRALGITVLEDVVAVVMMTLLTSMSAHYGNDNASAEGDIGKTLWLMLGFIALLVVVGLLILPRLFRVLNRQGAGDLIILLVAGMLFSASILASRAGYSMALGAFLFGAVVAETASRETIERAFSGAREMFSSVFFVSIGLQIVPRSLWDNFGWILFFSVFVIGIRMLSASTGLLVTGSSTRDALRSGMTVVPIGEFSYIMAQLGKGVLPEMAYSLAVGVSLVTAMAAPLLVRYSDGLAGWAEDHQPNFFRRGIEAYQAWLEDIEQKQRSNIIWQHSKRRLFFALIEVVMVGGLVGFSVPLNIWLWHSLESIGWDFMGWEVVYWVVITLLVAFPLVGLWRSLDILGMLFADVTAREIGKGAKTRYVVEKIIRCLIVLFVIGLLMPLVPLGLKRPWLIVATALVCVILATLLWRHLTKWHNAVRNRLEGALSGNQAPGARFKSVFRYRENWNTELLECALPDNAECSGKKLVELALRTRFGCSVVQLERQGVLISNPPAGLALFPGDKLLLFGSPLQVAAGQRFLHQVRNADNPLSTFDESELGTVMVPLGSSRSGKTLAELEVFRYAGIQILAIDRDGAVTLNPSASEVILCGDNLLVLGTAEQIRQFFNWLDQPTIG